METCAVQQAQTLNQLTFSSQAPLARASASQDRERDWTTRVVSWRSSFFALLTRHAPAGWFVRTSPASCHQTEDGTLVPSSGRWANSGMGGPIECWTLSISEFPSDAVVCSLSDILETGDVPQRYFLSAKACRGAVRRLERLQNLKARGSTVIEQLRLLMLDMVPNGEVINGISEAISYGETANHQD